MKLRKWRFGSIPRMVLSHLCSDGSHNLPPIFSLCFMLQVWWDPSVIDQILEFLV